MTPLPHVMSPPGMSVEGKLGPALPRAREGRPLEPGVYHHLARLHAAYRGATVEGFMGDGRHPRGRGAHLLRWRLSQALRHRGVRAGLVNRR